MKLIQSPQRSDNSVTYSRDGTDLLINGERVDLSGDWAVLEPDAEGEPLEPSGMLLAGEVVDGEIVLTVRAPHRANAPNAALFPEPIELADGESVTFPDYYLPEVTDAEGE